MTTIGARSDDSEPTLQEQISRRAREFDLGPLLRLLAAEGYPPEAVTFESNAELVSSARLIESITFPPGPDTRVVITLNLGLLGQNGLLPSYFLAVAEQARDPEIFFDFIRFFDHRLIEGFFAAVQPEDNAHLWRNWEHIKSFYFRMLGLGSTSTLQWLFGLYLPELRVRVSRHGFSTATSSHAAYVGNARLDGTAILGKTYGANNDGFRVDVFADDERSPRGIAWPHVLQERLDDRILPLLRHARLPIVVTLTVLERPGSARLVREGFLGIERMGLHGEERHTMVVFEGRTDM